MSTENNGNTIIVNNTMSGNAGRDGSTGLTWLWSALFGPIYLIWHGFPWRALLCAVICFFTLGLGCLIAGPVLAYGGWRKRAERGY